MKKFSTCIRGVITNVDVKFSVEGANHQEGEKDHHNKVTQEDVVSTVAEMINRFY